MDNSIVNIVYQNVLTECVKQMDHKQYNLVVEEIKRIGEGEVDKIKMCFCPFIKNKVDEILRFQTEMSTYGTDMPFQMSVKMFLNQCYLNSLGDMFDGEIEKLETTLCGLLN